MNGVQTKQLNHTFGCPAVLSVRSTFFPIQDMPNISERSQILLFADDKIKKPGSLSLGEFCLDLFKIHSWLDWNEITLKTDKATLINVRTILMIPDFLLL